MDAEEREEEWRCFELLSLDDQRDIIKQSWLSRINPTNTTSS